MGDDDLMAIGEGDGGTYSFGPEPDGDE